MCVFLSLCLWFGLGFAFGFALVLAWLFMLLSMVLVWLFIVLSMLLACFSWVGSGFAGCFEWPPGTRSHSSRHRITRKTMKKHENNMRKNEKNDETTLEKNIKSMRFVWEAGFEQKHSYLWGIYTTRHEKNIKRWWKMRQHSAQKPSKTKKKTLKKHGKQMKNMNSKMKKRRQIEGLECCVEQEIHVFRGKMSIGLKISTRG